MKLHRGFAPLLLKVILAAAFLIGFCGIGNCMPESDSPKYHPDIESLLHSHSQCAAGYRYPDSAVYFSVHVLELADSIYGFDSQEYVEIFTSSIMQDIRHNRDLVCNYLYPAICDKFNPSTTGVRDAYYQLGTILENLNEYEKAKRVFSMASYIESSRFDQILARLHYYNAEQHISGGNLEKTLTPIFYEIQMLDTPEKEELQAIWASYVADYYISMNEESKALQILDPIPQEMLKQGSQISVRFGLAGEGV